MSWDDAGNNRAFLANTISSTSNGASIYLLARTKTDTYMTETGKPLKDDCFHAPMPSGPGGQFSYHVPFSNLVPAYGKNQKAVKDFLRWFHSSEVYDTWFASQQGFSVGATKAWASHKLWDIDPVMAPFRTAAESGRFAGYAGPAGRAAAETISKFIIVDMYAKAVQGMPAEDAVKWAHAELLKIYACGRHGALLSGDRLSDRNPAAALETLDLKLADHAIICWGGRYRDAGKQHRHPKVVQMGGDPHEVLPRQRRSRLFQYVSDQI